MNLSSYWPLYFNVYVLLSTNPLNFSLCWIGDNQNPEQNKTAISSFFLFSITGLIPYMDKRCGSVLLKCVIDNVFPSILLYSTDPWLPYTRQQFLILGPPLTLYHYFPFSHSYIRRVTVLWYNRILRRVFITLDSWS